MGYVNIDSDIGKTLRKYRRERGITQEELAVALNMGMTTISAYENGRIMPTPPADGGDEQGAPRVLGGYRLRSLAER